ncbi:MAG: hypothetical protein ACR2P4_00250 [Gammaproteobacteria bacterium]
MPIQVVNNPSATMRITARKSRRHRQKLRASARGRMICTGFYTGYAAFCRGYAQDTAQPKGLFFLAFGRHCGAIGSRVNTTITQIN